MTEEVTIAPLVHVSVSPPSAQELPTAYAVRLAAEYAAIESEAHKKAFGQYFTPGEIGSYLASLSTFAGSEARLLDPGFGTGVLACALVEHLVATGGQLATIHLDAYDVDAGVVPYAQAVLDHLKQWLHERHVVLHSQLILEDFIVSHSELWQFPLADVTPRYDLVISNPPYFKLNAADPRNNLARQRQLDQPNIYSLFVVLATLLTKPGGELIFIIPRSFCSGFYYERFRAFLYDYLRLDYFHLFHARDKAFKKDAVLQENIIFKATRFKQGPLPNYAVTVASSTGAHDLAGAEKLNGHLDEIVDLGSREKVLFLPTTEAERVLISNFKTWRHRLHDFGVEVSTGPVVAFRTTAHLSETASSEHVPLLWIDHVRRGQINWPNSRGRQQYVSLGAGRKLGLLPNRNYVLLRRFSAKDDKHRLIAAPYFAADWRQYASIGLENKLNYLYSKAGELTDVQTAGLSALLNSNIYDAFFRIFNGNTQVSATEARALPMPPLATIEEIGRQVLGQGQDATDAIVNQVLIHV
ncbi:Eco57I restriction-modification methylase domain-containing protein [Hymenobacter sp. NST-14]|uniref:Eco57I restriction-modification methylase domain-containing protein n=1 Tax=Hymenobacter piscis TaxID=2839984 RepID=UPI001C033E6B|nr:Eco57I restriction-modification methylase domain-containing protein [Hymenobacter piscis]MBT9395619.1 Eco57I restriction-modification methylase domain-containing protein [Hymenobacter piscis]